ncbi:MAG TPA: hypothetical protein VK348_11160, partial [Planctomycetota bacterium]|nr:hypothetical protein [Planctomycetota bacterium]
LGLSPPQLRRLVHRGAQDVDQLDWLAHGGVLPSPAGLPANVLPDPYGGDDPALRARAWLHSNCAHCHRPQGTALDFDLRYGTATAAMNVVGVRPTAGDLGLADPFRVAAGNREGSVLWLRLRMPGSQQMPPLCTDLLDPVGELLVGSWIDGLR